MNYIIRQAIRSFKKNSAICSSRFDIWYQSFIIWKNVSSFEIQKIAVW